MWVKGVSFADIGVGPSELLKGIMMKKDILNEVIAKLNSKKDGYCRITHKKGWLGFLEDGDLVFTAQELHQAFCEIFQNDGNKPRGEKLFCLRKRCNFTITSTRKPYRTEEALERFITASNPENYFNQIPIGGGRNPLILELREMHRGLPL